MQLSPHISSKDWREAECSAEASLKVFMLPRTIKLPAQIADLHLGTKEISKIAVPRFSSRVDIYVDEDGSQRKGFVGTVNLDRLGWATNVRRLLGGIDYLYVLDFPKRGHSPMITAI